MQSDFDIAAISYDTTFTNTTIGKAQRMQVYKQLNKSISLQETVTVLELNCGTGEDANYLHNLNHKVTATDISKEMILVAKTKNKDINFQQLDINHLHKHAFKENFDVIFSNFGGFNCLSKKEITTFFLSANKILKKHGKIVLVIMPKQTFWEKIYFFGKGNFKKINRRNSKKAIPANVDGVDVKTWYFNPKEITEISNGFTINKIKPIGLFVPPSYLQSSFLGKKRMVSFLNKLDIVFGFSFLAKFADHYYIELQKNTDL
jgi:ubiquinone/menaquinone biosynthesis C-methylase UbiE